MTDRIALLANNSPHPDLPHSGKLGGGGKCLLMLWQELPACGWDRIIACPGEGSFTDHARNMGADCMLYPYSQPSIQHPLSTFRNFRHWNRIIRNSGAEVIHANSQDVARSLLLSASHCNIPVVCHVHFPFSKQGVPWTFHRLPKPSAFIFNSKVVYDENWPELARYCPNSIARVVLNAVHSDFLPSPRPDTEVYRIAIIGNLTSMKHHEGFIEMAYHLLSKHPNCEFWVIGEDKEHRQVMLENLARDKGILERICFLGHRDDVHQLIKQAHVTVLTSSTEPFGLVVIESLASGRPVVATRVGGVPNTIRDSETGFLVEFGDWKAMADRVSRLLEDKALWVKITENGLHDVKERFSPHRFACEIAEVYDLVTRQ